MRIWHYTIANRFLKIVESGAIIPATAGIEPGERPAVWLTTKNGWEGTATKLVSIHSGPVRKATSEEMESMGLIRIEVARSTNLHPWDKFVKKSGISTETAQGLADVARKQGSDVRDWFVSFAPIPINRWLSIELWNGERWVPKVPLK